MRWTKGWVSALGDKRAEAESSRPPRDSAGGGFASAPACWRQVGDRLSQPMGLQQPLTGLSSRGIFVLHILVASPLSVQGSGTLGGVCVGAYPLTPPNLLSRTVMGRICDRFVLLLSNFVVRELSDGMTPMIRIWIFFFLGGDLRAPDGVAQARRRRTNRTEGGKDCPQTGAFVRDPQRESTQQRTGARQWDSLSPEGGWKALPIRACAPAVGGVGKRIDKEGNHGETGILCRYQRLSVRRQ